MLDPIELAARRGVAKAISLLGECDPFSEEDTARSAATNRTERKNDDITEGHLVTKL